ncbi:50S ribosomal protein L5 [Candidatus Woesearchaeota archaeon]|nr:50S ribosomal protein L5 [Candidatus Woesearchaeota archaeon]
MAEKENNRKENPMRSIMIEKVVLHVGTGKEVRDLERGEKLLSKFTSQKITKTLAKKRIPTWGIRPGLPIGVMVTLRGKDAEEILERLLKARDNKLKESCFDDYGNINFGIEEYIEIPGLKYDPEIEIMGLQVSIALRRRGQRVQHRKVKRSKIGKNHKVSRQEAIEYMKNKYGLIVEAE